MAQLAGRRGGAPPPLSVPPRRTAPPHSGADSGPVATEAYRFINTIFEISVLWNNTKAGFVRHINKASQLRARDPFPKQDTSGAETPSDSQRPPGTCRPTGGACFIEYSQILQSGIDFFNRPI